MLESRLRQLFRKKCKEHNLLAIPLTGTAWAGVPDVYVVDLNLFVEFKRPDGKGTVSPIQIETHTQIKRHGGQVIIIDDRKQMEAIWALKALKS